MDEEQSVLAALADDLRVRILAITRDRPASITELASELGRPKGTVGYHVKVLERAGLVRVVRTRRVRAVTEKYYGWHADDLSAFGVIQARILEADADHFARRLDDLMREFTEAEGRGGTLFTLVAALYPADSET
jgi:DNA-binding transcriptional ArsR family regulator